MFFVLKEEEGMKANLKGGDGGDGVSNVVWTQNGKDKWSIGL
jgi:hypothetical protein